MPEQTTAGVEQATMIAYFKTTSAPAASDESSGETVVNRLGIYVTGDGLEPAIFRIMRITSGGRVMSDSVRYSIESATSAEAFDSSLRGYEDPTWEELPEQSIPFGSLDFVRSSGDALVGAIRDGKGPEEIGEAKSTYKSDLLDFVRTYLPQFHERFA